MADRIDHLTDRVLVVEDKVDRLSTTVSELSASVTAGFVEQREYTEFSHARIEAGFTRLERKLDHLIDVHRPSHPRKRRN